MICSNCNKQIPDDSSFCPNCGIRVEHTSNDNTSASDAMIAATVKPNNKSGKRIMPIAIIVIAIILGIFLISKLGDKPENVVINQLEALQDVNVDKFLDTLPSYYKNEILYEYGGSMTEIANALYELKLEIEYELGRDWMKQLDVSLVYKDDYNAVVNLIFQGEAYSVDLIKEDGKWKLTEVLFD